MKKTGNGGAASGTAGGTAGGAAGGTRSGAADAGVQRLEDSGYQIIPDIVETDGGTWRLIDKVGVLIISPSLMSH